MPGRTLHAGPPTASAGLPRRSRGHVPVFLVDVATGLVERITPAREVARILNRSRPPRRAYRGGPHDVCRIARGVCGRAAADATPQTLARCRASRPTASRSRAIRVDPLRRCRCSVFRDAPAKARAAAGACSGSTAGRSACSADGGTGAGTRSSQSHRGTQWCSRTRAARPGAARRSSTRCVATPGAARATATCSRSRTRSPRAPISTAPGWPRWAARSAATW